MRSRYAGEGTTGTTRNSKQKPKGLKAFLSPGWILSLLVILIIRDNSKARTGRKILNRFMYAAVSAMTTNQARRRENHLPALYQQLFMLLNLFPGENRATSSSLRRSLTVIGSQVHSPPAAANSAAGFGHPEVRRTTPYGVFLCPRYGGPCVGALWGCRVP